MNTPRQKPLRRYGSPRNRKPHVTPDGKFSGGLWSADHAKLVGQIATYLPQIEEMMIRFLALLMGDRNAPARQIFRSLNSEQARMQIMTSLLEDAPHNKDKGAEYEAIISAFGSVKKKRNSYIHGIWNTHDESGRVFLSEASPDEMNFFDSREVSLEELESTIKEMSALFSAITKLLYPKPFVPTSLDTLPPLPDEEST